MGHRPQPLSALLPYLFHALTCSFSCIWRLWSAFSFQMDLSVLRWREKLQIFQPIVRSISIQMMHPFMFVQQTPKMFFHNKAVFPHMILMAKRVLRLINPYIAKGVNIPTAFPERVVFAFKRVISRGRFFLRRMPMMTFNKTARPTLEGLLSLGCVSSDRRLLPASAFAQSGRNECFHILRDWINRSRASMGLLPSMTMPVFGSSLCDAFQSLPTTASTIKHGLMIQQGRR